MKYKRIQPNEIVRLLNSTVPSGSTKKMSLLYQAKQIPANRSIFEEIKSIQTKIVDLTLSISKNSRIIATNKSKISKEQSTPDFEPNQSILLSMESLNPNQGSLFVDDQDVVNTLRSIGRLKNAKLLETQNQERSKENEVMALEKHNLSSYLWTSYPHHFTRGLYGEIDNAVDWLTSRSYGRQRYGMITTASFNLPRELASDEGSLTLNPHHSVDQSIMDQYHFLWSSSGHLLHPAYCSIFDRTGRFLITGADDYLVKIWDTETGQLVKTCRGHGGHVTVIAVSHDNSIMATACTSGSVRIWRLSDGKCLALMEHTGVVNWLQFDLLTGALISAGDDGQCIVWDLTCYIPFDKTDCFSDPSEYEEGGRRWWVGEIPITSCPLLKCCLESSSQKLSSPDQTPLRCGTFSWNMHDVTRNKLGCLSLPHVKDGLSGEPIKIFTFDICPRDNILATGCEDGIARIWRFDQKVFDETAIGSDSEKRSENLTKLEKMRGILSALDYSKFETTTLYLLFRLEGHMDEVTDLKFSNVGDRLCSGSMKDGTVRIWAFSKDYLRNEMLLLDLNENQQEDSDLHGQSSGGLSRHRNQINYKTEIYNIAWSCDDQMIFVVHSKVPKKLTRIHSHQISTKLSVFNSVAGTLLNSFTISERKSHVLAAHPLNPSIVFTGGEDGYMNIWNVERGVIISQHQLLSPPNITEIMESNLPVDILDASFSPDGLRIAVTDSIGRAILLGRDNPEKFKNVFPEQYFSTDYAVVVHDDHGWPIDEGTQLPIHLAPVGPLVNINHTQYPIQPKFSSFAFPQPLPFNLIVRMRKEILDDRPHWNRTIHHSYLAIRKHKNRLSQGNQSSQTNKNHSIWGHKSTSVQRSVTTSSLFRERRRHAIIVSDDEGEPPPEEDVFYQFSDSDESHFENDHNIRRSQRNRMIVSSRGRRLGTRRGDSESQIRTRAARAISRRVNREVDMDVEALSEDDTEESVANISEENDDEKPEDEKKLTRRVDRKKKDREETLSLAYSSWMTVRSKGKYHRIIPIGTLIERDWLLLDSPSDHEYCPQVGDKVMYFPQGHINHLNLLPEQRRPPWMSFPMKWPVVECRIISISYDFPTHSEYNKCPSILAKLQLQLIGRPLRWGNNCHPGQIYSSFGPLRESRNTTPQDIIFEVTLRHSTLPDFLVPSYLYYRCSIINWQPSVEFVSYFLEYQDDQSTVYKDYKGIVCRVTDSDTRDWIHSPWESLEIQWINSSDVNTQGGDYERISPWDAILPEMTYPSKHFYSNSLNPEFQKNILDCINLLMIEEDYQAFSYPVDPTFFPDYDCIIPVPMYLDLIKRRLENNFYRQVG